MTQTTNQNSPEYLHGSTDPVIGTQNSEILGGSTGDDTIHAGDGNDLLYGDTNTSNPAVPFDYTALLDATAFGPGTVQYSINGNPQTDQLAVGLDGSALLTLDPSYVDGNDLTVEMTGWITEFQYEFFDAVPSGMSAANIPNSGADFSGVVSDLNVRELALDLTGSHETYSVRYTTQLAIEQGGTYTFSTRSDDGSILLVNGIEVVSNDGLHSPRTEDGDITLGAGTHTVEIVFFENRGGDVLEVSLSGPDTNNDTVDLVNSGMVGRQETVTQTVTPADITITGMLAGMQYELFDSVPDDFSVFNIPADSPDYTGIAEELNVGALAQELTGSRETYSVRYTGELYVTAAGVYDFSSLSDDGFALLIDGVAVILNDGLHAPSSRDGSVQLDAGLHEVEILFFENTGQDVLEITFSGPDTNGQQIDLFSSPNIGHRGDIVATVGGDDLINGGEGDDTIDGGAGNDAIVGGTGADDIDGGDGDRDIASFRLSDDAVEVDLDTGVGSGGDAEGDTYQNIEFLHGSAYDDILAGDGNVNRLVGMDGVDELYGRGGNDTLIGGRGGDYLDGGDGVDTAEYDWSASGVVVDLSTGVGAGGYAEGDTLVNIENLVGSFYGDVLSGDGGRNRLNGNDGDDVINGGAGNDVLIGGLGADELNGGEGDRDVADYSNANSGVEVDLVTGGTTGEALGDTYTGIEFVYGSAFDDQISGNSANNRLIGFEGNDVIFGREGNDYIIGMDGNDFLTGGVGDDVFLYKGIFDDDVITDFEAGVGRTDRIWLDLDGINSISDITITDTANGALIDVATYGTILLEGVLTVDLASDDFIF